MKIEYKQGDATNPDQQSLIVHICNNAGGWGSGFVMALSAKDPTPEKDYRKWAKAGELPSGTPFQLGEIQLTRLGEHLVANMIAQDNISGIQPPIRYEALRECLETVAYVARRTALPVVGPKFGSGIAGGDWNHIEEIINDTLIANDIPVTIYTLP